MYIGGIAMEPVGSIVKIEEVSQKEIEEMFCLMTEFYDNVEKDVFLKDFMEKDYCIFLRDEKGTIKGFSSQKIWEIDYYGKKIHGVFSGDTVIHRENWGSLSLFQIFARFFFSYGKKFDNFYWFLIVKGYKTYKILPTFFNDFYPDIRKETPPEIKDIMNFLGYSRFPNEYNSETGVIEYKGIKDSLKKGVADITEKELKDKYIRFFLEKNPHYEKGDDLLCLTSLKKENLKEKVKKILFSEE